MVYNLFKQAKEHTKLGIANMGGMAAFGAIGKISPQASAAIPNLTTGLNLTSIGSTAKIGFDLSKTFK